VGLSQAPPARLASLSLRSGRQLAQKELSLHVSRIESNVEVLDVEFVACAVAVGGMNDEFCLTAPKVMRPIRILEP
jgi:hypothetical protein